MVEHSQAATEMTQPMYDFVGRHTSTLSNSLLRYATSEAAHPRGRKDDNDLDLLVGWRDGAFFLGISIGGKSPGHDDLEYRHKLFSRMIDVMGLTETIKITFDQDRLVLSAANPKCMDIRFLDSDGKGGNARAFDLRGFEDLAGARASLDTVFEKVVRSVDDVAYYVSIPTAEYERLRDELNGIARVWKCHFLGRLRAPVAELVGAGMGTTDCPRRIPVFEWNEDRQETFFQGDVMVASEDLWIEITSNCGDMERLLKGAEEATGIPFEPVLEQGDAS